MFLPLFWLLKISGVLPTNYKYNAFFFGVTFLFYVLSICFVVFNANNYDESTTGKIHVVSDTFFFGSFLVHWLHVWSKKVIIAELWNRLVSLNGFSGNSLKTVRSFELFAFATYVVELLFRVYYECLKKGLKGGFLVLVLALPYLPTLLHLSLVRRLSEKFSSLNNELMASSTINIRQLRFVFCRHADLRLQLEKVNSFFGCNITLFQTSQLVFMLTRGFLDLKMITEPKLPYTAKIVYLTAITAFFADCEISHRCNQQAQATHLLSLKMINMESSLEVIKETEEFSLGAFNNPPRVSVMGVVTLGRSLYVKLAAMALSYLFIALQLSELSLSGATTTESPASTANITELP